MSLIMSGCKSSRKSIYINDSRRITVLDVNESGHLGGILISAGWFEELLDYEDKVLSGDCD